MTTGLLSVTDSFTFVKLQSIYVSGTEQIEFFKNNNHNEGTCAAY